MLEKSQILVEIEPSALSPSHKLYFGNSSHKIRQRRYQSLAVSSNFTRFLYFVSNILFKIVGNWPEVVHVNNQ